MALILTNIHGQADKFNKRTYSVVLNEILVKALLLPCWRASFTLSTAPNVSMYSVQHLSQKPPQELKTLHSKLHSHILSLRGQPADNDESWKNSFLKYSLYRKNKYRFKGKRCFTLHHSRVILLVFVLQRIRKQFHMLICTGIIIQSDTACNHLPNKTQSEGIVWQSTCGNSEKSTTCWPFPRKNVGNKSIFTTQGVAAMKNSELEFKFGLRSKLYRCCFHLISYKNNTQPFKTLFFLIRLISLCVISVYVSVGEHSISVFPCWANDSSKLNKQTR